MSYEAANVSLYRILGPTVVEEPDIERMRAEILHLVKNTPFIRLAVDFGAVNVVSSRALGLLVAVRKEVKMMKGQMVFFGISPAIAKVMTVTRMHTLFSILPSEQEAIDALKAGSDLPFWNTDTGDS